MEIRHYINQDLQLEGNQVLIKGNVRLFVCGNRVLAQFAQKQEVLTELT